MTRSSLWYLLVAVEILATTRAPAQAWRLRVDAAAQRVEFRGVTPDSILAADARVGPTGGLETSEGFAVTCIGGVYCHYYRPGDIRAGVPVSAGADMTLWGLGVTGLSVRANARILGDLTGDRLWPGTAPAVRVVEGYAEYLHNGLIIQGGRTLERGRLASSGYSGLDGFRGSWHPDSSHFEFGGYAGWGMARGTILSVTSPAVDPLAEYQPSSRQIVLGALTALHLDRVDVQTEYRRELDPVTNYIVSDRAAASVLTSLTPRIRLVGGADYDVAQGQWGSAEASGTYSSTRFSGTLTARHYRPFFDLWTVWGVFSPVAYNGISGVFTATPSPTVQLRSRAEWFKYDDAGVDVPNVHLEDRGWRWGLQGTVVPATHWTLDLGAHGELLPGASSQGIDGKIGWQPRPDLDLSINGGSLTRPLELRFQDAGVTYAGAAAGYRAGERVRIDVAIDRYWQSRDRPDAASFDWNQWRLSLRTSFTLRSAADRWLPPARPQGPTP